MITQKKLTKIHKYLSDKGLKMPVQFENRKFVENGDVTQHINIAFGSKIKTDDWEKIFKILNDER